VGGLVSYPLGCFYPLEISPRSVIARNPFATMHSSKQSIHKLAVIGDPISHSISPALHSFLIEQFDLPLSYERQHVSASELKCFVQRMRGGEFAGINVTIPHKRAILPLLDDLDPLAERIGAVNTVINSHDLLIGHNTDAAGFRLALEAADISVAHEDCLVLGAGGAAVAVVHSLLENEAGTVYLSNRHLERAEHLVSEMPNQYRDRLRLIEWEQLHEWLAMEPVRVIINATSAGMSPDSKTTPIPQAHFTSEMIAIDLIYNPLETVFLHQARNAGARTLNGLPMLIYQGVAAMELWGGQKLSLEGLYPNLENLLMKALSK